ncbi:hypothetical protein CR513_09645, partial [Mucuna pruriens]
MFELLTRNTSLPTPATTPGAASNAATQGTPAYPAGISPQYRMPLGWNTPAEAQVVEEPKPVEASRPATPGRRGPPSGVRRPSPHRMKRLVPWNSKYGSSKV